MQMTKVGPSNDFCDCSSMERGEGSSGRRRGGDRKSRRFSFKLNAGMNIEIQINSFFSPHKCYEIVIICMTVVARQRIKAFKDYSDESHQLHAMPTTIAIIIYKEVNQILLSQKMIYETILRSMGISHQNHPTKI